VDVCDLPLSRSQLLVEIRRLYARLRTLPTHEQPDTNRGCGSGTYLAIEAQIRSLAELYKTTDDDDVGTRSHETVDAEPVTTRRRCG
jgi:hypothetical protein